MFIITLVGRRFWKETRVIVVMSIIGMLVIWLMLQFILPVVSNSKRLLPIYNVYSTEKKVSLSFDACWGAEKTPELLRILKENNVKTTFFLVNIWLKDYHDQARAIIEDGHEIGMHSISHPHFTTLSQAEIIKELRENHDLIAKITGYDAKLFRPPYGDYNDEVIRTVNELGYIPIQWDVDSLDWREGYTSARIYERVTKRIKPGSIILFHNNGAYTAEALPDVIGYLKKEGYEIVPISELLIRGDYYIDVNGTQQPGGGNE